MVLGLVYTLPAHPADRKELRDVGLWRQEEDNEEVCLEYAMKSVEMNRQMEGVLEFEGRGKVGFLVYRQD